MMSTTQVCLIEDDDILGESLCERFRLEGLSSTWYRTGRPAMVALQSREFGVVLCDLRLPDMSGNAIFEAVPPARRPPFIFMTGFGMIDEAVSLLKSGAEDFLTKPFDLDGLMQRLHRLLQPGVGAGSGPRLGISPSTRKIEALIDRLSESTEPVLLTGESGAGKEEACRLLHERSGSQRSGAWVTVNCAALPESLIEAELFGYVRGAFTGAVKAHKGLIEQANGGTLFLDEIGDMPPVTQVRLLRVLQERRITRIGAEGQTPVDFRLVCATHRDLPAMVRVGSFREDLYYRINVIAIHIPALRDRREDILWIADRMLQDLARAQKAACRVLTLAAQQALYAHAWPGNVRQLNHVLRRALALSGGPVIDAADLFPEAEPAVSANVLPAEPRSLGAYIESAERSYLVATLQTHRGAVGDAAAALGISRKTLWEKMRRHRLDRLQFAGGAELTDSGA